MCATNRRSNRKKKSLYKTLIRPIITYEAETWTMYADIGKRLAIGSEKDIRTSKGQLQMETEI